MTATGRVRYQVEGPHGGYILVIDHQPVDDATARVIDEVARQLLDDMRAAGIADPAAVAAALLVERIAEERAYERVAASRGVLAL